MRVISKKKIEELRKKLLEKKIDSAVFICYEPSYDTNVEYLTGLRIGRGDSTNCLIFSKGKMILAVSSLEYEQAAKEAEVDEIIELGRKNRLSDILKRKIKSGSNVGINSYLLPYGISKIFPKVRFKNISGIMDNLRAVKEPKEIETLERACRITNFGVNYLEENISTKITEKDLAIGLEDELRKRGAEEMSFKTIVTSGKRSSLIHPVPSFSSAKIGKGFGLVDFGILYKGYCTDSTVPFAIGKLSTKQEKMIKAVEEARGWVMENIRPGVPTWKLFEGAEKIIKSGGFSLDFCISHGIGLDVHDSPTLGAKPTNPKALKKWKEVLLQENMVLAIEPGVYVPKVGGFRIENDFLVTKWGVKKLTKAKIVFRD